MTTTLSSVFIKPDDNITFEALGNDSHVAVRIDSCGTSGSITLFFRAETGAEVIDNLITALAHAKNYALKKSQEKEHVNTERETHT